MMEVWMSTVQTDTYWRRARLVKVIDGDTLDLEIDLGFYLYTIQRVRLLGIDTPELRSKDPDERHRGQVAKAEVEMWLTVSEAAGGPWPLLVRTEKDDSFGRWLAVIFNREGRSLGQYLLDTGFAKEYLK